MSGRVSNLRAALTERAERVAGRPKALCRVCGGWAHAGVGTRAPEPELSTARARSDRDFWLRTLPADVDEWRRTCATCAHHANERRAARAALVALIGVNDLTEADADTVLGTLVDWDERGQAFSGGVTAKAHGRATGKAWEHVTQAERDALNVAYAALVASRMSSACTSGACGGCGRATAPGTWWEAPSTLTWPSGARVAFCAVCAAVWRLRGEPSALDDLRRVGVECATGWPVPLGVGIPASFRLFCESKAADPAGLDEPWSWSEALTEYRERVWTNRPDAAPDARRVEFEDRHRRSMRAMREEFEAAAAERVAATW